MISRVIAHGQAIFRVLAVMSRMGSIDITHSGVLEVTVQSKQCIEGICHVPAVPIRIHVR
jgi:hypothetical protein